MPDIKFLEQYVPYSELKVLLDNLLLRGEEGAYFTDLLAGLAKQIKSVPPLYANEEIGLKATVKLHYFCGATDFWITELDPEERLAFGYTCLNGDSANAELGYISIPELLSISMMQLDLYWGEKTLEEIIKEVKAR